jgi:hypothetical protein
MGTRSFPSEEHQHESMWKNAVERNVDAAQKLINTRRLMNLTDGNKNK